MMESITATTAAHNIAHRCAFALLNASIMSCQIDGQVFCDVEDTVPAAPRKGTIVFGDASATTVDFRDLQLKRITQPR